MRRILVEAARRKGCERRGGASATAPTCWRVTSCATASATKILDLDEALTKLPPSSTRQAAELVKLRAFGGMTVEEVAEHLGISPRTAKRTWAYARAWLGCAMAGEPEPKG